MSIYTATITSEFIDELGRIEKDTMSLSNLGI